MLTDPEFPLWHAPPPACRPLQIVHAFHDYLQPGEQPADPIRQALERLRDLGLGGIVCNTGGTNADYLRDDAHWQVVAAALDACREFDLRVWIYDEKGYPSGPAGGRLLEADPRLEALAMVHDPDAAAPFYTRPAYEHAMPMCSWHVLRRYPNLLDPRATDLFLHLTHESYARRFPDAFEGLVEAFFTDEPALAAINLGGLAPGIASPPIVDAPDPSVRALPSIPWAPDLSNAYQHRFGEPLEPLLPELFGGNSPRARLSRRRFWSLVGDLFASRFFGRISRWCAAHQTLCSGHALHEESPLAQIPLMGNPLACLRAMDAPGLDLLTADPRDALGLGWICAALPASAALHCGRRRVMVELCDHIQRHSCGRPGVDPDEMRASAAWLAALGVTDFTLYFRAHDRPPADYRSFCDTVGRLNACLLDAVPEPHTLLYYPVHRLQEEYVPVAGRFTLEGQSPAAQRLVSSLLRCGQTLVRAQTPFVLADDDYLERLVFNDTGWSDGAHHYHALVLPDGVLPDVAIVRDWPLSWHGRALADKNDDEIDASRLHDAGLPAVVLDPPTDTIVAGLFRRCARPLLLLVNVGPNDWRGQVRIPAVPRPGALHYPDTGAVAPFPDDATLSLPARSSVIVSQSA